MLHAIFLNQLHKHRAQLLRLRRVIRGIFHRLFVRFVARLHDVEIIERVHQRITSRLQLPLHAQAIAHRALDEIKHVQTRSNESLDVIHHSKPVLSMTPKRARAELRHLDITALHRLRARHHEPSRLDVLDVHHLCVRNRHARFAAIHRARCKVVA